MRTGLRVKRDVEARRMAAELLERGHGHRSTAKALRIPRQTVKQWRRIYRALGSGAPPTMDGEQARHTHERKVAAASAAVDGGATKAEATAGLGIVPGAPPERWRRPCREGGAEALGPKPRGGPRGSKPGPRERARGREPEERRRGLEAEVAYLKELRAPVERDGPWPGRGPRRRPRRGRTGTAWGACSRARGRRGRPTATRRRARPGRRARGRAGRSRRSSRARPTAAATAGPPCACARSWARASPARPRSG